MSRIETWFFVDNEGCLTPGKGLPFDLEGIIAVRSILRERPELHLVITTGRSAPYCEALWQLMGCSSEPLICEGGAGLWWPRSGLFENLGKPFPRAQVLARLAEIPAELELGKANCLSLYPRDCTPDDLLPKCRVALGSMVEMLELACSVAAVDITMRGISKGSAIVAYSQRFACQPFRLVAFGDGMNDLPMFEVVEWKACPSNARPELQARADFVSRQNHVWGLLDALKQTMPQPR